MLFLARFEKDVLAEKKTITIRDEADSHYEPGSVVDAIIYEEGRMFCQLEVVGNEPVLLSELNEVHAREENMSLTQLRIVLEEIYPGTEQLFVVSFRLVKK
ncbi:ASCH domain-containing protein [Photobacterium sanctipauli]|uniref:ASCH domain-containing protein n=1 Tax=Photobacterium sanctipauli TaxID=1342794 RepID=A0A2T3NZ76_9GAMM|nr:N(4)-acetylcytidine aminohydrolase [Photobacterium sanctipauli]PSW21571.1 ASCH domain-containing protein [Photobacterium sanctipauli]